jgi:hypothetical protein
MAEDTVEDIMAVATTEAVTMAEAIMAEATTGGP